VQLSDFDFELPPERIAQEPAARRDASRLLVYDRATGEIGAHTRFHELPRLLPPGALLVLNDTRVIPARLLGHKLSGGKAEVLLIQREQGSPDGTREVWHALLKTSKAHSGMQIDLAPGFTATLLDTVENSTPPVRRIELRGGPEVGGVAAAIHKLGQLPLPPYIQRQAPKEADRERYQTVFARREGSCAAPTAGLHFTQELLGELKKGGVHTAYVTLHVGPGTFLPVREDDPRQHKMHAERFEISEETAQQLAQARAEKRPIVAVGTTVVRTLESAAREDGTVKAGPGETALFIMPGYRFRVIDALITNFHLPKSTLLMLVCAFGGQEGVLRAYREAVANQYRFFSYGDAMLLR
jgi:S-adenosylmethionine:tRNA ribosyltransferase-isomerase